MFPSLGIIKNVRCFFVHKKNEKITRENLIVSTSAVRSRVRYPVSFSIACVRATDVGCAEKLSCFIAHASTRWIRISGHSLRKITPCYYVIFTFLRFPFLIKSYAVVIVLHVIHTILVKNTTFFKKDLEIYVIGHRLALNRNIVYFETSVLLIKKIYSVKYVEKISSNYFLILLKIYW